MENIFIFQKGTLIFINIFLLLQVFNFINNSPFSPSMRNIINEIIYNNIYLYENDKENNSTKTNELEILYKDVIEGIENFINDNIYQNENGTFFNETSCYNIFKNIDNETNQKNIKFMIEYSNLQLLTDVSHEIECKRNNLTYFFISYKYKSFSSIPIEKEKILNFLNYNIIFTSGLCLVRECKNIVLDNFNTADKNDFGYKLKDNSKLYNLLNDTIDLKTFTLYKDNTNDEKDENNRYSETNPIFLTILIVFILIFLIRIFFSIYYNIKLISINKKKLELEEKDKKSNIESKDSDSEEFFLTKIYQEESNKFEENFSSEEKYMHFIDFISIIKNLLALGETKNYMYNNENLEIPCGFQSIALFFFALVNTFYNYVYYPSTDYFNSKIFFKYHMSLLKFAQYSSYFYLSLNGFIYSFKFMNYYKNHIHDKTDKIIKYILLYFLTFIPKLIMFIITSFVFHSYSINILNSLTNYLYQNEFKQRLKPRKCLKEMYLYIFFFNSYLKDDKMEGFIHCYNYMYSFVNEFYAIIFVIILFFICLKVRSKKIDVIVIILIILNLICNFIFFHFRSQFKVNETHYDFTAFLGEKLSIKYFHIYLNIFFYGAIAGIIYFYKMDVISTNRITRSSYSRNNPSDGYFPFSFLDNICNFNLSKFKRLILIIINFSILVLLCSVFPIENRIHKDDTFFVLNYFLSFIHIYENHIATVIFIIIVLLFATMDRDSAVKNIFNSWPFIFINRIGYFFYSICETTILIFFVITNYQTYLNLSDLLFLNSGQFICGIIISTIFVVLIEIPLRYYCKKLRKLFEEKKNDNNNDSSKKESIEDEKMKLELRTFSNQSESDNNNILNDS